MDNLNKELKCQVYRNLNYKCWSIKQKGIVRCYVSLDEFWLEDCTMLVGPAGRNRTLREQRKNVHACISGYVTDVKIASFKGLVTYNPYKWPTFVDTRTESPVLRADIVKFHKDKVFYT